MDCLFYTINDIAMILSVSHVQAEKIVREMNKRMADEGYDVIRGKINKGYFWDSIYISKNHEYYEGLGF